MGKEGVEIVKSLSTYINSNVTFLYDKSLNFLDSQFTQTLPLMTLIFLYDSQNYKHLY